MCGIVGCAGNGDCVEFLISGLKRLEYRGYDSAGVAVVQNGGIRVRKAKGRLDTLCGILEQSPVHGNTGIGHTRWATHGEPSLGNAHPHVDEAGNIALVHNGIIENYYEIRSMLMAKGVKFLSETDTETVVQLLGYYYDGDMLSTLTRVLPLLRGSYALAIIDSDRPDTVYCTRKDSPLVVGMSGFGGVAASDIPALLRYTRDVYLMDDGEIAVITQDSVSFFDALKNPVTKQTCHIDWDIEAAEKGGFEHFMLKEIHEQPKVLRDTLEHYVDTEKGTLRDWGFSLCGDSPVKRISVLACGTAYHAGMAGKAVIEKLARVRVDVDIASEYRYRDFPIDSEELCIVVSQSGETLDTIAAMRRAKGAGCRVLALCNVIGSTVAREADAVMYTLAGPEIAVASTKAYISQLLLFELIALRLAFERGEMDGAALKNSIRELSQLPDKAAGLLETKGDIQQFAASQVAVKNVFFLGRTLDYCLALEAALKLKEISYLHSEAYSAGELKHGTIALIEDGSLVVTFATQKPVFEKMLSNIEEVRVRGARVLLVSQLDCARTEGKCDVWKLPEAPDEFMPMLSIIPMQLFAYYMALLRGCDIDKPRNLAKSVTVE